MNPGGMQNLVCRVVYSVNYHDENLFLHIVSKLILVKKTSTVKSVTTLISRNRFSYFSEPISLERKINFQAVMCVLIRHFMKLSPVNKLALTFTNCVWSLLMFILLLLLQILVFNVFWHEWISILNIYITWILERRIQIW